MTGNALANLFILIGLVMSTTLIVTATIFFWTDIGGGLNKRKFIFLFAVVGWALYLFIITPFL